MSGGRSPSANSTSRGSAGALIAASPPDARTSRPARRRSEQMLHAVLLALQLGQRLVDAAAAELVDRQRFDDLVVAAGAGERIAEDDVARDPVFAVRRHPHRHPLAAGSQDRKSTRLN